MCLIRRPFGTTERRNDAYLVTYEVLPSTDMRKFVLYLLSYVSVDHYRVIDVITSIALAICRSSSDINYNVMRFGVTNLNNCC